PDEAARHYETALELLGNAANRPAELGDVDLVSLTARASDAMLASGDLHRALSLVQDQLAHLPADAPVTDRVTLLMTLGLAAIMGDTPVNALEVTSEAMALLPVEPTRLRARLMAAHAWANAEWQRDEEAMRWAQDARELGGRLGLRSVVADATTTIARLEERAGNPEESKRVFEKIVAQARTDGDVHAELRGLHHLGGLHFEAGQFAEAQRYYSRAVVRAAETNRPWSPYGFDTRVMGAIAAYITGDWDEVARIVDVTGEAPPELIEVSLAAIGLGVAAGRGDADALRTFQRVRPWWDKDGVVAIYSGAAAIDLYADSGDYKSAIRVYEEVVDSVTALWQVSTFLARFRLSGLLLGQLATCGTRLGTTERAELVRTGDRLLDAVRTTRRRAADRGRRIGPEGLAWTARVEAEHLRLRWLTGVDSPPEDELVGAWRETVAAFTRLGHVFELARSRARLSAVLRSLGQTAEARELADQAREVARRLGAEPLLVELRVHGPGRRTDDRARATEVLTPREQEILALVAEGRSNAEIARQLYISAKTVSVHVSNILAKLGAAGRTEAVAVARRRGLLAD
ncbi:MAG TPA: LuxR C-terminal-related transcriptional regulator, partial [Actinomycetes bacterium]|nr:LuxR C-terminal-related transcriptional regulator [Actinomycetes bacterium]